MKTVALLTDFGLKDNFVGVMKAVILNINPQLNLVDITHQVGSGNIQEAAFLLFSSFKFFPQGTIFLVVVDPGVGSKRKAIALKTKNYYFVGPDNGVLSLAAKSDGIKKIVSLTSKKYFLKEVSSTFHGRDIFSPCAGFISKGLSLERLGSPLERIKELGIPKIKIENNNLYGEIIYIDKFGNLVTNITLKDFENFVKKRRFKAWIKSKTIKKIYSFYQEAKEGEFFFCKGSFGFLEISLKNKSASTLLKAKLKDKVTIKILDK